MQENTINKKYAVHKVYIKRIPTSIGNNVEHNAYDYIKGDFIKEVNVPDIHAEQFNKHSHNSAQRMYLLEDTTSVETKPAE